MWYWFSALWTSLHFCSKNRFIIAKTTLKPSIDKMASDVWGNASFVYTLTKYLRCICRGCWKSVGKFSFTQADREKKVLFFLKKTFLWNWKRFIAAKSISLQWKNLIQSCIVFKEIFIKLNYITSRTIKRVDMLTAFLETMLSGVLTS